MDSRLLIVVGVGALLILTRHTPGHSDDVVGTEYSGLIVKDQKRKAVPTPLVEPDPEYIPKTPLANS